MRKKVCAPAHIDTAGAAVLNSDALSTAVCGATRSDKLSTATAMVAGAGPNISANAMKNVSAIEMAANTDANLIVKKPATIASTAKRIHSRGCGAADGAHQREKDDSRADGHDDLQVQP